MTEQQARIANARRQAQHREREAKRKQQQQMTCDQAAQLCAMARHAQQSGVTLGIGTKLQPDAEVLRKLTIFLARQAKATGLRNKRQPKAAKG